MRFQVDSDSEVTKGIAALLVEALSGHTPADVRKVMPLCFQVGRGRASLAGERDGGREGVRRERARDVNYASVRETVPLRYYEN